MDKGIGAQVWHYLGECIVTRDGHEQGMHPAHSQGMEPVAQWGSRWLHAFSVD